MNWKQKKISRPVNIKLEQLSNKLCLCIYVYIYIFAFSIFRLFSIFSSCCEHQINSRDWKYFLSRNKKTKIFRVELISVEREMRWILLESGKHEKHKEFSVYSFLSKTLPKSEWLNSLVNSVGDATFISSTFPIVSLFSDDDDDYYYSLLDTWTS